MHALGVHHHRVLLKASSAGSCCRGQSLLAGLQHGPVGLAGRRRCVAVAAEANGNGHYDFDLITIGAGTGGVRASRFASQYGAKVAVCELPFGYKSAEGQGGIGGTCVLRGCVPKKLMVFASQFADDFRDSVGFGWEERPLPAHHWQAMLDAKHQELNRLMSAYKKTLADAKVETMEGRGKLLDAHTVEIAGKKYTARNILIATGSKAVKPGSIKGAELCITSDDALELPSRPKKIAVIGGGYIGAEFSGIFNRFGSDVHFIFREKIPLGRVFDDELKAFAFEQYKASGVNMHPQAQPNEVRKEADGTLTVLGETTDKQPFELRGCDQVLLATGRAPNTKGMGLEDAGVKLGAKGGIEVDEYSRTSVPSIWAIGDVTQRIPLTPVALMEGMAVAKSIVKGELTKPDYDAVPSAVFSNPQVATVGLSEQAAKEKYADLDIYTSSFKPMRATLSGAPQKAFCKIVVDGNTRKLLGMHMVGDNAAEIMQGYAVAVKAGVTKEQLDSTVSIHPTAAEELVSMRLLTRKVRQGALVPA